MHAGLLVAVLALGTPRLATAAQEPSPPTARDATRVGVLPLVIVGDVAPEVGDARQRLSREVHETLTGAHYDAVLLSADQTGDAQSPYCGDQICWQQLATQHDVTHFLVVVVHHTDPDYRIEARLVDGRTGQDAGTQAMACDLCGISELEQRVRDVAATMRREIEATMTPPPTLVVTSTPAGARVTVDGEPVGITPLEVTAVAGRHRIEVTHPDYVLDAYDVDLVDGVRREIVARLRLRPPPVSSDADGGGAPRSGGLWLGLGAGGIAAGAGAIVGGAVMIAIHDDPVARDCDGSNVDPQGRCRYLHDTRGGGIALTVTGVALLAAGVVATVVSTRRRRASRRAATIAPAGLGLYGRF